MCVCVCICVCVCGGVSGEGMGGEGVSQMNQLGLSAQGPD